jgi:hypothetical protein
MRRHVLLLGLGLAVVATGCRFPVMVEARHRADLVVASIGDPPADGTTVESFTVPVSTDNIGGGAARRTVTRLFLSLDEQPGDADTVLGEVRVPRLRFGSGPYETSIDVTVPASVQPVAYHLLACADALDRVKELDEYNNCRASARTISFAPPPPPPPPPPGEGSSQALIAQDLEAGRIDYGTSLIYRAWTLFWDPRLPERYDGTGSTGEDRDLFLAIEAALPTLPPEQQAELEGFVVRPTDPRSSFGPAPLAAGAAIAAAAEAAPTPTKCAAPKQWFSGDWPNNNTEKGFRAWVCDETRDAANGVIDQVLAVGAAVWDKMTGPDPDGMGVPAPDTNAPDNDGNGKIDVYVLDTNQCRDRQGACEQITGAVAVEVQSDPCNSTGAEQISGFPAHACSAYMLLSRNRLAENFTGDFVHEFFHVLQDAHNADAWRREIISIGSEVVWEKSWYSEASATWAAWYYAKDPDAYALFVNAFQNNNRSLLEFGDDHEYGSWVWPLLMQRKVGRAAIFASWRDAEAAEDPRELDDAVDRNLRFADRFRDLSVSNLNPSEYFDAGGVGLEADLWQTEVLDFPKDPHVHNTQGTIALGDQPVFVEAAPLAADDSPFEIQDNAVRKVTIDIASLAHADSADIDVVGRLAPDGNGGPPTWHRIRGSGTKLTFCRDKASENFDLIYVVLSNHSRARDALAGGPDSDASVQGAYTIKAENACQPDGLAGTISWTLSYESDRSGGGVINTDSATEQGTIQLDLVRDPTRADALWYIDDGTSSFSVTSSGAGVYDDGSCRGESTYAGQASGAFSTYQDPYGRTPLLDAFALGARPVLDADTNFLGVFAAIPYQVAVHSESTGLSCGGSSDSVQDTYAFTMPGNTIVCFPPGVDPVNGISSNLIGDWNNDAKQFEFGCTASVTTEDSVKTLTVTGVLSPA